MTQTAPRLSRRERKELTRQRLIEALLRIARDEGLAAATTKRIAQAAGIRQPSFYGHYASIDDCIRDATEEVGADIRRILREARRKIVLTDPAKMLRVTYAVMFDAFLEHRDLTELFLRYRRDPSPMGEVFREAIDASRQDLVDDMRRIGLCENTLPHFDIHVELILMSALAGVEGLIDGRFDDREAVIDVLTHNTQHALMAAVARQ